MTRLNCDFETRSTVDLKKRGTYAYARHPSTEIMCMGFAFGDEEVKLWVPGDPFPRDIWDRWETVTEFRAWNAQFERLIWHYKMALLPDAIWVDADQWFDTAAEAAAMALPRKLEKAALALGLAETKDTEGHRLMLKMSKPRKVNEDGSIVWFEDPDDLQRLYEYCKQDVRTERAVGKVVRELGPYERKIYLLDQKINDRGVRIDVPLVEASQSIVEHAISDLNSTLSNITDGEVDKVTKTGKLRTWLEKVGFPVTSVDKEAIRDLLEQELPDPVRRVAELRQEGAKTSTAKLTSMLAYLEGDDKARGMLLYHGAGTGRWSGKGPQPHNFPRPSVEDIEQYIPAVMSGSLPQGKPLEVVSSLLRSMLIASADCRLMAGDYAQIEARIVAWVAGQGSLVEYKDMAAAIYNQPADSIVKGSAEYQVGKATVLGAGFGMGGNTHKATLKKNANLDISLEDAQHAIETFRRMCPQIKDFWWSIYSTAFSAVTTPGVTYSCGRLGEAEIQFVVKGNFLWCILPSGRPLCYAYPRIEDWPVPWGGEKRTLTFMGVNSLTQQWERRGSYGGLFTENVVQAMARDVMAAAMVRLEKAGYPVVLSVHDELISDVPNGHGSLEEYEELMSRKPMWARTLPVAVEAWEGQRYRK